MGFERKEERREVVMKKTFVVAIVMVFLLRVWVSAERHPGTVDIRLVGGHGNQLFCLPHVEPPRKSNIPFSSAASLLFPTRPSAITVLQVQLLPAVVRTTGLAAQGC